MIKTAGLVLLCSSILFAGWSRMRGLYANAENGKKAVLLLRYIRAQLAGFNMPYDEIFRRCRLEFDRGCFDGRLREHGLKDALREAGKSIFPDRELFEILSEFADGLGRSGSEEQLRHCDFYLARLEERISLMEKALSGQVKTCASVSFAGAALLLILFL